jgi:hypothetical protein
MECAALEQKQYLKNKHTLKFKITPDEDISNNKDTSFQTGLAPTDLHSKW